MKYTFFYDGVFSNWYKSIFKVKNHTYTHMEQYMMHQKALLFKDNVTATKIMNTPHPRDQKALGREIKNFDPVIWDKNKEDIVYEGLKEKFLQNRSMLLILKQTGDTVLVEASPTDRIWGIGYNEDSALDNIDNWGENLLGKLLTKLKTQINENLTDTIKS